MTVTLTNNDMLTLEGGVIEWEPAMTTTQLHETRPQPRTPEWFPHWFPTGSQHPPGSPVLSGSPGSPSP